ncbi:response regulator transcription factor [Flavobacterium johnsoniae]|jgi:DNA-binding NarL/FixJ family response regulator|uniref:Two component transcriptional regulator, LuxR family n=2 Tax=Flavobacterium johnsoniae TaxID=986 RepID=A5FMH2_FLAJ1|nr:response regulator transcription factor [Flavobacterium johnsoniae]ABQ03594.1 two component transcriptional regulator, LuxR family [Flavobacterium johnsoniae UW101]OXE96015.1 DNA-binding response regulator [Flavobacterium johnsoniae UW101]WQG79542.1 response regulator transcription factor [Flavobacterium johnsoniae UW101]
MSKKYKMVVVDDHPIVISGISGLLSDLDNIEIVEKMQSGALLLDYIENNEVDLVLIDIFLPVVTGIDLCKAIKQKYSQVIVIGMSSQSERSLVMQFIQNGGNGYILKSASFEEFKNCINKAIEGEIVFSDEVKTIVSQPLSEDLDNIPSLSRREKDIALLLSKGKQTQEIADELFLSFLTVQTHRRNILQKYKTKNVAELITLLLKNNLLD